jgi:hypothetical protein
MYGWNLTSECLSTNGTSGNRDSVSELLENLQVELDLTTELCDALDSKAGFLQGRGIENVRVEYFCIVRQVPSLFTAFIYSILNSMKCRKTHELMLLVSLYIFSSTCFSSMLHDACQVSLYGSLDPLLV